MKGRILLGLGNCLYKGNGVVYGIRISDVYEDEDIRGLGFNFKENRNKEGRDNGLGLGLGMEKGRH